jgi:hypothetical protein
VRAAVTADKRIYLRLGDSVTHRNYEEWGEGVVVEEMTSTVPGGTCLVRILFQDGRQRTFNNDLDNELCCYYFGIRKQLQFDFEGVTRSQRTTRRIGRR